MHAHVLSSFGLRFSRTLLLLALICFSFASARAAAAEIVVKNDTVFGPGYPATPDPFVNEHEPNLRLGAWLTSPIDGLIVGIQIAWGSVNGTADPIVQGPIRISSYEDDGGFPNPGPLWATIQSPTLLDGIVNEYRHLDPATGLLPLAIPVVAGQGFLIDLELPQVYAENDPNAPGVLMDQGFENTFEFRDLAFLPSRPQFWNPLLLATSDTGNFGIRAIIQPVPEPSACALAALGIVGLLAAHRRKSPA